MRIKLLPAIRISQLTSTKPMVVALVVALAALAGVSPLFYPSAFSPLLVLGGIAAIALFAAWVSRPAWALYTALVLVFLPIGLIPPNIHSILNRSMVVIAAGVWAIRLLGARRIVWTGPALLMLLFLIWSGFTLFWAEWLDPALSTIQVYSLRFLLFLLLIPNAIRNMDDLNGLMKTLAAIGWILMVAVIASVWTQGYTAGSRLHIFGENVNTTGIHGLVAMVGVLWAATQPAVRFRTAKTLAAAVYIFLMVGLMAMSGSRGGAISLLVTLAAFWLWRPLRGWARLGLLAGILTLVFAPFIFTTLLERFTLQGGGTPLGGREVLWWAGWQMIEDHPLAGVGIGNSPFLSVRVVDLGMRVVAQGRAAVHNPILVIWSETGVPGLILYVGILVSAMYSFGRSFLRFGRLKSSPILPYFALVSCVTLGYMISWIKGGGMESGFSYFMILALLGLPSTLNALGVASAMPERPPTAEPAAQ